MELLELLPALMIRSLPTIVSLLLTISNFNFTLMLNSIETETNQDKCPVYKEQQKKPRKERFDCFKPGTTAISVTSAAIALAMTILINSYLSNVEIVRGLGFFMGFILFCIVIIYAHDYRREIFRLGEKLPRSPRWILRLVGKNPPVAANLVTFIISLIFYFYLLLF